MMEAHSIDQVCKQVYQRFPDLRGSRPQVQPYAGGQFLLLFTGTAKTADGRTMNQTVRVVASADGAIKKMTTSR
jgi:hypothetical protein